MDKLKQIKRGQFFTRGDSWLKPQVLKYIKSTKSKFCYDPFAGGGDLLKLKDTYEIDYMRGLDLDPILGWRLNDSLVDIPHIDDAIIITNPPYLSKNSTTRKGIMNEMTKYFETTEYDDLYMLALDKMLEAQDNIVAILPETFINSNYKQKGRLVSITILEENPFSDTKTPVCVACFDGKIKEFSEIKVYKNEDYLFSLEDLEAKRLKPTRSVNIKFNDLEGWLGLRAIDTTNPEELIKFGEKSDFNYDWDKHINISSRALTLINIDIPDNKKKEFINECNTVLKEVREDTKDTILSPFKCNMKNGKRRRRLDFKTARAIIEIAYERNIKK